MALVARGCLIFLLGCAGDLPGPPYVPQPTAALVPVQYPPPPARVEFVPPRPAGASVWVDGEWVWMSRRWSWHSGRWVVPPPEARFSPWAAVWAADGTLYYANGAWRDANDRQVAEPPPLATGRAGMGQIIDPEGEQETTGKIHEPRKPKLPPPDAGPDALGLPIVPLPARELRRTRPVEPA
jgi:hypothetical protein